MPHNIAVIGLGWVALARHIPAILRNPDLRLVGVVDRDAARAAAIAARLGLSYHAGGDMDDLSWRDEIDAVTVGAPPFAHADIACAALGMGKHVLTEKPFAMSRAEGAAMLSAADTAKKTLAVVHNFQFARAFGKLRRDIAAGKLGPIRWIAAQQLGNPRRRLPRWYQQLPLGLFYDESPHFFYLLRKLAGSLQLRDALAWKRGEDGKTPDEIRLVYQGDGGIPVTVTCNFVSPLSEWTIMVAGEDRLGIVDIFRDFYISLPQDGLHTLPQIVGTSLSACAQHLWQYAPNGIDYLRGRLDYGNDAVIGGFAGALGGGVVPEGMSAADAMAVLELQQQAVESVRWL